MDFSADLSQAILRRETKEAVAALLGKLTPADRKAVLLDLLAEGAVAAPPLTQPATQVNTMIAAAVARVAPSKVAAVQQGGSAKLGDRLLALVRQKPGMPISEMGQALYGDAGADGQNKARSLMASLRKKGLVESFATGKWKAVEPDLFTETKAPGGPA